MRLVGFRVQNYKVVDDTGWVPVDPQVTALVGKNESGKTAIMKALWKAKNVADVRFDKLVDFPRHRYVRERHGRQEVVSLEFELTDDEAGRLAEQFPFSLRSRPGKVWYSASYDGEEDTSTKVTFEEHIEKLFARPAIAACKAVETVADAFTKAAPEHIEAIDKVRSSAIAAIDQDAPLWDAANVVALDGFASAVEGWIGEDESRGDFAARQREKLKEIIELAKQGDPSAAARCWVVEHMPAFIYFDTYGQLVTRIHLPSYLKLRDSADARTRSQAALFEWSRLDPQEILELGREADKSETEGRVRRRKDLRRALLDSASAALTGEWIEWWTDKRHRLHFDADGEDLLLTVSDEQYEFPIPFEERSHGFQWFFSFYLVFLVEGAKAHRGAILLLDEPGLHLHPTLQSKLIGLFDRIAKDNQLIYSTHLPFLVDGDNLDRVRTVYLSDHEPPHIVVSRDGRPKGDWETLFPLQAAVGYSVARGLLQGKRTVIVEGVTDYWLLKSLSDCLAALGADKFLDEQTILIPAGGASRLIPLASVMSSANDGANGHQLVLLDSNKYAARLAADLRELFGDHSSLMMLGDVMDRPSATVEDLIPREVYANAARKSARRCKLSPAERREATNIVAMESLFRRQGWGRFGPAERASTALKLVGAWGQDPKKVPAATRDAALALFTAINERFDQEGG